MRNRIRRSMIGLVLVSVLSVACSGGSLPLAGGGRTVTISMVYGSEKEAWLVPLIEAFNVQKNKTEEGSTIVVEATPMGSIASGDGIVEGKPHQHCIAATGKHRVTCNAQRSLDGLPDSFFGEAPNDRAIIAVETIDDTIMATYIDATVRDRR